MDARVRVGVVVRVTRKRRMADVRGRGWEEDDGRIFVWWYVVLLVVLG